MPGFPDKNMPFMDEPPGAHMSTAAVEVYGRTVRALRRFTLDSMDAQPECRRRGVPDGGYRPPWDDTEGESGGRK
jgi:hydrogenase small subunit